MSEIVWVSLLGAGAFGALFLMLCPEWWSSSLGTLKNKKPGVQEPGQDE
ncbi:MAG: hypothetical protein ACXU86_02935 [Archangium sp.]